MPLVYLLFGGLFGFSLVKAEATEYDKIAGMFRPIPGIWDYHLPGVMAVGIATAGLGLLLLKRTQAPALAGGKGYGYSPAPVRPALFLAGLTFGLGWGLSGACPGTALGMIGQGKVYALATVAGMLIGNYLYALGQEPVLRQAAEAEAAEPRPEPQEAPAGAGS